MTVVRRLVAAPDWSWPAGLALAFVVFSLPTLLDYPPIYADEPWDLSAPISILRAGRNALPIFGEDYSAALYYNVYLAGFFALPGVDMSTARLISLIHGAGIVIVASLIARELGLGRSAAFAAVALPFIFPFSETSHYVRPDVISAFYGFAGVWLDVTGERRADRRLRLAGGACSALAAAFFPLGVWAVVVIGLRAISSRDVRTVAAVITGGTVALAPLGVFIALDPSDYSRFLIKFGGSSFFGAGSRDLWGTLARVATTEPQRYAAFAAWPATSLYSVVVLVAIVVGVIFVVRTKAYVLLMLIGTPALVLTLLALNKTSTYLLILTVPVALLFATVVRARATVGVVLVALLATGYLVSVTPKVVDRPTGFRQIAAAYAEAFRERQGSVVIGSPVVYAYFLNDRDIEFRSFHVFTRFEDFRLDTAGANAAKLEALARGRPIYLVYDEATFFDTMRQFDLDGSRGDEFVGFVRERFVPETDLSFSGTPYGDFSVTIARYAVPWSARPASAPLARTPRGF
jgi:hypothetical protein